MNIYFLLVSVWVSSLLPSPQPSGSSCNHCLPPVIQYHICLFSVAWQYLGPAGSLLLQGRAKGAQESASNLDVLRSASTHRPGFCTLSTLDLSMDHWPFGIGKLGTLAPPASWTIVPYAALPPSTSLTSASSTLLRTPLSPSVAPDKFLASGFPLRSRGHQDLHHLSTTSALQLRGGLHPCHPCLRSSLWI